MKQSWYDNTWECTLDIQEEKHGNLVLAGGGLGKVDQGVDGVRGVLAGSSSKLAVGEKLERFGKEG